MQLKEIRGNCLGIGTIDIHVCKSTEIFFREPAKVRGSAENYSDISDKRVQMVDINVHVLFCPLVAVLK